MEKEITIEQLVAEHNEHLIDAGKVLSDCIDHIHAATAKLIRATEQTEVEGSITGVGAPTFKTMDAIRWLVRAMAGEAAMHIMMSEPNGSIHRFMALREECSDRINAMNEIYEQAVLHNANTNSDADGAEDVC